MAPKRARRAESSSVQAQSSDSSGMGGSGVNKFTSPEAQAEYTRLLGKPIAKERVFLPSPGDGELVEMIQERGWESFCEAPGPIPMLMLGRIKTGTRLFGV